MNNIELEINNFLEYLKNKNYSDATINGYYFGVKDFLDFLTISGINYLKFTQNNVDTYQAQLISKNSTQTINSKLYAINKFKEYLNNNRGANIGYEVKHIKNSGKKTITTINNFDMILKYIEGNNYIKTRIQERDKLIFKLLYYTGIKTNDLLKIKKSDCREQIIKLKNNEILIDSNLSNDINEYVKFLNLNNDQYLFTSYAPRIIKSTAPLTQKSIQDFFNKYTEHIDKNLSIIDLRSSYIQNLLTRPNVNIEKIYSSTTFKNENEFLKI